MPRRELRPLGAYKKTEIYVAKDVKFCNVSAKIVCCHLVFFAVAVLRGIGLCSRRVPVVRQSSNRFPEWFHPVNQLVL